MFNLPPPRHTSTLQLNGPARAGGARYALRHGLVRHEPGRHHPAATRLRTSRALRKQEERPQTLIVIVYRSALPDSSPVLCRNDIVDVSHPDGVKGDTLSSQPEKEVVGGGAVVLNVAVERPRSWRSHLSKITISA